MKTRKIIALMLCVIVLLLQSAACGSTAGTADESGSATTGEITSAEPAPEEIEIAAEKETSYRIVRPDKLGSDAPTVTAALKLRNAVNQATEANINIDNDWFHETMKPLLPQDKEVLIGATDRDETRRAVGRIREKDFVICTENDRIVVAGGSEEATVRAVDYFIEHFVDAKNKAVRVPGNLDIIVRYDYYYDSLSIAGVPLSEYRVVYPAGSDQNDKPVYYSAMNLADMIKNYSGLDIAFVPDSEPETKYELLVGATNRAASAEAAKKTLADDEYLLAIADGKVVMTGKGYMPGAAAGALMNESFAADRKGSSVDAKIATLSEAKPAKVTWKKAQSAILLIGDGMGRNHVLASLAEKKIDSFIPDMIDMTWCTTYSQSVTDGSASYTDSAAAGTALACGHKTINGYIAMDKRLRSVENLRELAFGTGAKSSILTTDAITGATPAVFLAHQKSRKDTDEIQAQIDQVVADGGVDYCRGKVGDELFADTRESLGIISDNGSPFFTMIEEAYTDKGAHDNKFDVVYNAVKRLNECAAYAIAFSYLHRDTVLLITADHETGGITLGSDGKYGFTKTTHTNTDVPVYGVGPGVSEFLAKDKVDNTDISKFIAKIYGAEKWGQ